MKIIAVGEEEGLADNIVEIPSYDAPMPPKRAKDEFLPWHRPRKQYVRHYQWCHEVRELIRANAPADGTLKYLGLPGVDLLDLRHFHSVLCEEHKVKLRFLGFNASARPRSAAQTELNVSMDEVKRLSHVHPLSDVVGDDFAMLANQKSIAFQKARELGPYDVINLDLCDGFGAQEPGVFANTYYDAVSSLLGLQARNAKPWLLLLTTRADKPNINTTVLNTLIEKYCSNLDDCISFKDASSELFDIDTREAVAEAIGQPVGLLHVFLTGLCKWFLGLALQHNPPTSVELRSVYGYRVDKGAENEDLVSLALKFTPTVTPAPDPLGLAAKVPEAPDEGALATKALRRLAKRIDADKKLRDDGVLMQRMTDATVGLLTQARYDPDSYREWLLTA
jgi:hypothetical protein